MQEPARRSPLRFIAPLALAGFVLALFMVVTGSTGGGDGGGATPTRPAADAQPSDEGNGGESRNGSDDDDEAARTTTSRSERPRTYTVKTGDTLGGISAQTGVSLERLQELNPNLDPQAMVAGQRLKLRE